MNEKEQKFPPDKPSEQTFDSKPGQPSQPERPSAINPHEVPSAPEGNEAYSEEEANRPSSETPQAETQPVPTSNTTPQQTPQQPLPEAEKSELYKEVEAILAEGLEGAFQVMDPQTQTAFRQKGEETADRIERLMQAAKAKAKQVLALIKNWLRMIPHVNKLFLEQESKIKTDKIVALSKKQERE